MCRRHKISVKKCELLISSHTGRNREKHKLFYQHSIPNGIRNKYPIKSRRDDIIIDYEIQILIKPRRGDIFLISHNKNDISPLRGLWLIF